MNIYIRELKAHRKSIIIWSIVMIIFVYMSMQKFSTMTNTQGGTAEFMNLVDKMPSFLKSMWSVGVIDISTAIGYFGAMIPYLFLIGAIHASMLGCSIIAKEERDKTAEFLMTKPVSRNKIITSKLMAVLTNIIIFNLVTYISSAITLKSYSSGPIAKEIILSMIATFLIQVLFMTIGIGLATSMRNPKRSTIITMIILLGCFFISLIIGINSKLDFLTFLTPFKYFDIKDLFVNYTINIGYVIMTLVVIIFMLYTGYEIYNKRDLNL